MTSQRAWPLTEAVLGLARKAAGSANPELAAAGRRAGERLSQPLRVALVGLVSAGKSTLLNALLETAVAPTAGGECTRVLYSFAYGRWNTAMLRPRTGQETRTLPFASGRLPSELPLPHGQIARVEVTLPADLLQLATVLDTPGLESTNSETSEVTQELLRNATLDAARSADALIFCINTPLKEAEAEAVRLFRSGRAGLSLTGGTAVAVLTKADLPMASGGLTVDRRTTWKRVTDLAHKLSTQHADLFADVVPVIGLLAETARTGALRERHARVLAALARAWDQETARANLLHEHLFYTEPAPADADADARRELVSLLGLFGVEVLLDALRDGVPPTAAALTEVALDASGFDDMSQRLRFQLGSRSDVWKSGAQLSALQEKARVARDAEIYSAAQQLLDRPEMFELKVFGLADVLASGRVKPPKKLEDQVWILLSTGLPPVSAKEAAHSAGEWREWAMLASLEGQSVARVMVRAWQLAARGKGVRSGPG